MPDPHGSAQQPFLRGQSDLYGRHLLAARDIQVGETVLQQQSYAAVLYDDQVALRCDYCFAASDSLMRCSRSKFAHYCCIAHQKAAWKAHYKLECAALVACYPNVPPATIRLAARVLWRRAREQGQQQQVQQQPQTMGSSYSAIEQLQSHWDDLDPARKILYAQMAIISRQYMQGGIKNQSPAASSSASNPSNDLQTDATNPNNLPDVKHIAQLLARFACNNHTVCDEELRPIGIGIYPLGALINHSCKPNCVQSFVGPNIVFRSLADIPAGEQLTISYVELLATRHERRTQLLQQYFFDIDAATVGQLSSSAGTDATAPSLKPASKQGQIKSNSSCGTAVPPAPKMVYLHCQHLLQQFPWAMVQRHGMPDTSSNPSSNHCTIALIGHQHSSQAPWPQDKPDKQLCQMQLLLLEDGEQQQPAGSCSKLSQTGKQSSRANNSTSTSASTQPGRLITLSGGMCLLQEQQAASGSDDTATAAAVAGLFSELEDLQRLSAGVNAQVDDRLTAAAHAGSAGMLTSGVASAQQCICEEITDSLVQQQEQQLLQCRIVQWGDWAAAVPSLGLSNAGSNNESAAASPVVLTTGLINSAAGMMLQVWAIQQQAYRLAIQGQAGAAMGVYQHATAVADGAVPQQQLQYEEVKQEQQRQQTGTGDTVMPQGMYTNHSHNTSKAATISQAAGSSSGSTCCNVDPAHSQFRVVLGPRHILKARLLAGLLKAAVDEGSSWQTALAAAQALLPIYEMVYPKVWPNLGLHYALIAKLCLLLEQPAEALHAAEAAGRILQVTHPTNAAVVQEAMQMRYQAQQDLQMLGLVDMS